mmetsp:Transcript_39701/g.63663  ORF Transcript_39701/g.63663 Transcript_39701/m.63663 type:complete len:201 (+) Transcript_39701:101-703(+)
MVAKDLATLEINAALAERDVARAGAKRVFQETLDHLVENGKDVYTAKGILRCGQKDIYKGMMPATQGPYYKAVCRANGADPEDPANKKKVCRTSLAAFLTGPGARDELWLRGRAFTMSQRFPDVDFKECLRVIMEDAVEKNSCINLNPDGSHVTALEQEQIIFNPVAALHGPSVLPARAGARPLALPAVSAATAPYAPAP